MKFCGFISIISLSLVCCLGKPNSTQWKGYVSQEDDFAYANRYASTMKFTQTHNKLVGENYFSVSKNDTMFVRFSFEGFIDGDTVRLKENAILEATRKKGEWYTKDITLYFKNKEKTILEGKWVAHRNREAFGYLHYELAP
jgi:hypothetical protein